MTPDTSTLPDSRFNEEGDWIAQQFFSPEDLRMAPEEYVARHGHALGCFSFHFYRYRDAALGTWVRRVAELLSTEEEVERGRQRYLTSEELATVRRQEAEGL